LYLKCLRVYYVNPQVGLVKGRGDG
jgi:hypothetical protein